MRKMCCLLLVGVAAFDAFAHTNVESNRVAIAILAYASMDNDDDLDAEAEYPVRYVDWDGLLDGVAFQGWTRQGKEDALFRYLDAQSTNDFSRIDGEVREFVRIGLCECRDLNRTNFLPVVRNLALNPTATFRGDAISVYYKWTGLDDGFFAATRALLMDGDIGMSRAIRAAACRGAMEAIGRHKTRLGMDGCYTNAMRIVYQARLNNVECAMGLDSMFVAEFPGYLLSSNRLATAIGWLDSANCGAQVAVQCVSITNRLMNVARPLCEVVALKGL